MALLMQNLRITIGSVMILLAASHACHAHFLWLKTIDHRAKEPRAFLYFGETATDEAYHLPERLAQTEVWRRGADGKRTKLETTNLETEDRIGLIARLPGDEACVLEAAQRYGIYGKSLLVYYAKHIHADSKRQFNAAGTSKDLALEIVPRVKKEQLELTVLWNGNPLQGAEVSIAVGEDDTAEKTTDDRGRVALELEGEGIVAVLASHLDKESRGEAEGKAYEGILHYASLTFERPTESKSDAQSDTAAQPQSALPPLPEPVSSFGAAVADGWLYVYSGHTGEEHQHSQANLSKYFGRIKVDGSSDWEKLSIQTPLQGLSLVAHAGKVYRIGGLDARNATTDDDEQLHSTNEFAEFDPATGRWKSLAPLPAPRSSHNAAVIGDRLYVVGGWHLDGESPGDWQADALAYDFSDAEAGWQRLPDPPFTRRALAVSHWHGKLVAIGGMNAKGKVSQRVDVFDPDSGQWSRGPDLPGAGLAGFGGAACAMEGQLYVSGLRGIVYRLNDMGSAWEEAARLARPRFFHQLLPVGDGALLAVGGASRKGHLADVESVKVTERRPSRGNADLSGTAE